eukprot:gnl/MRDRNA2_/MRDRNA2_135800_c0_seq1.p1 gnl/MRDRNA2_/MRDRNA2_135800_c0~~gnl/MRDRNA2_/MRDRNA2_135800_c0_seq1.p1  ORF type:complete len:433 (+),score=48.21 gnl/MRDRNA2_/MRDRNA2_135800_c0_seq1:148-1446(+)
MVKKLDCKHPWSFAVLSGLALSLAMFSDIYAMSCVIAFLPPELHNEGYSSWVISMVIGVYFAVAWATNGCMTAIQLSKLFNGALPEPSWQNVRNQLRSMIFATTTVLASLLFQGSGRQLGLSLIVTHTIARMVQGFAGVFIYWNSFLIAPVAFEDHQKTFVLTSMSLLPSIASLTGPFFGGALYTYYGALTMFVVVMCIPAMATILLFSMSMMLPIDGKDDPEGSSFIQATAQEPPIKGYKVLPTVFTDCAFIRALLCVCPPDFLRNAFSVMLPLFASVQGYAVFHIGLLPLISGSGFLIATFLLGFFWTDASPRARRWLGASLMVWLGIAAQIMFHSYFFDESRLLWYIALFVFGTLSAVGNLGSYHISDFADKQLYPAAFGIWNSLWLLSGVLGSLSAGFAAADNWEQQQAVFMVLGIITICAGVVLILV